MMNRSFSALLRLAALATSIVVIAGCSNSHETLPVVTRAKYDSPDSHAAHAIHWSYEGKEGPQFWGKLDPSYAPCSAGQNQSPIDLTGQTSKDQTNLELHYKPSALKILNNGHTVQANYDVGSYIVLGKARYNLLQFHFHSPSEHKLNGKTYAAELHLVHKSAAGKLAVVGVLLDNTASVDNPAFKPVFEHLPETTTKESAIAGVIEDASALLPVQHNTFRYSGSLTTPPCTEGVDWNVMTTPVKISAKQAMAFSHLFPDGDARPIQLGHGRKLNLHASR